MVKSADNGSGSIAPFLKKCYEMVDDETTNSIISWGSCSDSFVVWDRTRFSVQLLPKYFKHSNFSSFVRQLNIYGFRKIDADRWEFANEAFIRGQKDLLKSITRRKYPHASDQGKASEPVDTTPAEPCEDLENVRLWKEVENLKIDKNALTQELVKLTQNQETADKKLMLLKDRLQGMESSQQQMLSFLIMAMENPSFLSQLLKPKERNWRVAESGNMLDHTVDNYPPVTSDGMIVRYQLPIDGASKPVMDSEISPEFDAPSEGMKDFWLDIDFVKVLMDDNHIPFGPPDLHDDGAWEKLLFANPCLENGEHGRKDEETPSDSVMEVEETESETHQRRSHNFELMLQNMGSRQNFDIDPILYGSEMDASGNLELLTEQIEHLASENNQRDGLPSK